MNNLYSFLYSFIQTFCDEHNIDESHDVRHSKDCVKFLENLMDYSWSPEERRMAIYAAALHDCVDKKYVKEEVAIPRVLSFLLGLGWKDADAGALISMITTMSYSKLNSQRGLSGENVFPNHGEWDRVYHAVRQADLLCSYRVHRCYQYQKKIHPEWSESAHWIGVNTMFQQRMFKYVTNGWFQTPAAMALIPDLIRVAQLDLLDSNGVAPDGYGV